MLYINLPSDWECAAIFLTNLKIEENHREKCQLFFKGVISDFFFAQKDLLLFPGLSNKFFRTVFCLRHLLYFNSL